jgi:hypothetical protein
MRQPAWCQYANRPRDLQAPAGIVKIRVGLFPFFRYALRLDCSFTGTHSPI